MSAWPDRIMGPGNRTHTGGGHAPTPSYPPPPPRPSPRRRTPARPPAAPGLQAEDLGPGPLVAAAGRRRPDHLAVRRLRAPRPSPPDETAREALLATLPDYAELQRRLNAALAGHLPKVLCRRLQKLAIDLTLIPYASRTRETSGWSRPTLTDAEERTATVSICVKCRNSRGQWKRHGRRALISASRGYQPASPESVFATYRLRFGIESSYRQMHEGRIRTSSRRPDVRLPYVGVASVPRDLWVWLHDAVPATPRRGGRVILLERLRREALLLWLLHVVEEAFGVADVTYTERDVEYELAM